MTSSWWTASSDVIDRVVGLESGASDYVANPFDPRELLARVKSVLRRLQTRPAAADEAPALASTAAAAMAAAEASAVRQRTGRCELDLQSRRMFESGGPEVTVTAMEFELLRVFLANPNRALSRDQQLVHTRTREWEPYDRSIDIRIGRLRRNVEPEPDGEPRCVPTVRNVGCMFAPAN